MLICPADIVEAYIFLDKLLLLFLTRSVLTENLLKLQPKQT